MKNRVLLPAVAAALLLIMGLYFLINPSYQKSITAKYYFETADYKEAYNLAKEAFSLDVYNRMASTIMAQSTTSLKYVRYIDESKKYMKTINQIATKDIISDADKAKMRMMCEIMTGSYIKLAPSVITDTQLTKDAAEYNDMFEKLLEKVDR